VKLALADLWGARRPQLGRDLAGAATVTFLSVPQGVAYAMIAGLPPAMGLYAGAVPVIVGSLFRSSHLVVSGPSNAVSLLVGTATAAAAERAGMDPVQVAVTLALMVGVIQTGAGLLRLGVLVDYVSRSVVLGYISGAAVLIGAGQLSNVTGTAGARGNLPEQLWSWMQGLDQVHGWSVGLALAAAALVLVLHRVAPKVPGALMAMVAGIAASWGLDLAGRGVKVSGDIGQVAAGLPPLSVPGGLDLFELAPLAFAATVLSLVESSAVGRSLAAKSGDRLDADTEFVGQGLANLAAAFTSGYPVSGSLARSILNHASGASSRLSGVLSGAMVLAVLLLAGPVVDFTPIPVLAGILLVVAWRMIDRAAIARTLRSSQVDALAFVGTVAGTFLVRLDLAVYLGVGISLVVFLRRARLLRAGELRFDARGRLREHEPERPGGTACTAVKVLHLEGSLFFGAAGELRDLLDEAVEDGTRVLVARVKRCHDLDATTALVFAEVAEGLERSGRHLLLVGMRPRAMEVLEASGTTGRVGADALFPTQPGWFVALDQALERALDLAGEHACGDRCPAVSYLASRASQRPAPSEVSPR